MKILILTTIFLLLFQQGCYFDNKEVKIKRILESHSHIKDEEFIFVNIRDSCIRYYIQNENDVDQRVIDKIDEQAMKYYLYSEIPTYRVDSIENANYLITLY